MSKTGTGKFDPSTGQYGFYTAGSSEIGKRKRGKTEDRTATRIKSAAEDALDILRKQYESTYGAAGQKSIYDEQLELAEREKDFKEESFIGEAESQAARLGTNIGEGLRQTEMQAASTGFAGSGNVGNAREALSRELASSTGDIYKSLTDKKRASDLDFERLQFQTEQEKQRELDRISLEASSIRRQAQEALGQLDRTATIENYRFDPNLETYQQHLEDLGVKGG